MGFVLFVFEGYLVGLGLLFCFRFCKVVVF